MYELDSQATKQRKEKEVIFCIYQTCLEKPSSFFLPFNLRSIGVHRPPAATAGPNACLVVGGQPSMPSH